MTMPHERSRAVIQTRDFLDELSRNLHTPETIRKEATRLLRLYPTAFEIYLAAHQAVADPKLVIEPMFWPSQTFGIESTRLREENKSG